MRIGIEGGSWINPRGFGRFLHGLHGELLRRGRHEWILALDAPTARASRLPEGTPHQVIPTDWAAGQGAAAYHRRSLREMFRMSRGLARGRYDAILFPSQLTYVPVPGAREILIMHDVTAERFPLLVFESALAARRWRWKTSVAMRRARKIITVSEHSRRGIAEIYGVDPAKILVAPEAPDPVFLTPARPVTRARPYVLYVGGLQPHKNIAVLLEAIERLPDLDLVLAGPFKSDLFHAGDLSGTIKRLNLTDRVEMIADSDDPSLRDLYAGALALVLPSLEEGFGLPAVESAAVGTPLVLSKTTAASDIFGDAALHFDPQDAAELAFQIERLRDNPVRRRELSEKAQAKARAMTWQRAAEVVEEAAEEVASA